MTYTYTYRYASPLKPSFADAETIRIFVPTGTTEPSQKPTVLALGLPGCSKVPLGPTRRNRSASKGRLELLGGRLATKKCRPGLLWQHSSTRKFGA